MHKAFEDCPSPFSFSISHFEFDVGVPSVIIGFPFHPSFEDLPCSCVVPQNVFHVDKFVPKLVHSRKQCHCTIPQIASMVDILVLHFHFCILQPYRYIFIVNVEGSLVYIPRSVEKLCVRNAQGTSTWDTYRCISPWLSSHFAYFSQLDMRPRCLRIWSSNSFLFRSLYSSNSSASVIFCLGGAYSASCLSCAVRMICSAVICTGAGDLFLTWTKNEFCPFDLLWRYNIFVPAAFSASECALGDRLQTLCARIK